MSSNDLTVPSPIAPRTRLLHRLALLQAIVLLAAVVIALPIALRSISSELIAEEAHTLYAFPSGQPITADAMRVDEDAENFINLSAIDLDADNGSVTLAISGHRNCKEGCTPLQLTLFSFDDDATVRGALPPSASLTLDATEPFFNQTVQLPIRGRPRQFPFDDYSLWLGLTGTFTQDGQQVPLTRDLLADTAVITTQNQVRDFTMSPPSEIDPARVQAISDPVDLVGVQQLVFGRPAHEEILAILLVGLIAVSAIMAVSLHNVSDLLIGIGGLVLGIWGVRSVLVPSSLSVVTSVDLALSLVILILLLGLSLRAALHFHKTSGLPGIRLPKRNP
jgi:hypothetical protein